MFHFITNFLEPFACFLYFIALLINYRRRRQSAALALAGYYASAALLLLIGCFNIGGKMNNIWIYDCAALLTAVCVGLYFYRLLQAPLKKKTVVVLIGLSLVYAFDRHLTLQGERLFDSLGYSLVSASVTVYVFMYFHQLLKNVTETNILNEFNFWLSSGYLIYFLGSFLIFVSYYYFTQKYFTNITRADRRLLTALWGLHNVLLFMGAISLLIGSLWVTYRRKSR